MATARKVRPAARTATGRATAVLPTEEHLSTSLLVGQVQAASADMLRSLGIDQERAQGMVGEEAVTAAGMGGQTVRREQRTRPEPVR